MIRLKGKLNRITLKKSSAFRSKQTDVDGIKNNISDDEVVEDGGIEKFISPYSLYHDDEDDDTNVDFQGVANDDLLAYRSRSISCAVTYALEGDMFIRQSNVDDMFHWQDQLKTFQLLRLPLPSAPLFKDSTDFIPRVPIFSLLDKFNGESVHHPVENSKTVEKFSLRLLPPYLVFVIGRFMQNNFFVEKNPTIVDFPLRGLDLKDYVHPDYVDINPETR
jgi:hypothetical protein